MQVLEFETKKEMTLEMWTDRQEKIQAFFGPGVSADIKQTGQVSCASIPQGNTSIQHALRDGTASRTSLSVCIVLPTILAQLFKGCACCGSTSRA